MEETRSALADKLEALENQVVKTVQDATSAVTDTVENVKDAVQETVDTVKGTVQDTVDTVKGSVNETVESVKETFDLERQMDRRPWLIVGGSIAAGFVAGRIVHGLEARRPPVYHPPAFTPPVTQNGPAFTGRSAADPSDRYQPAAAAEPARAPEPPRPQEPGLLDSLVTSLQPEMNRLKGLALGALGGLIRDLVVQQVPDPLRPRVKDLMNDITRKIGGEPIQQPLMSPENEREPFRQHASV